MGVDYIAFWASGGYYHVHIIMLFFPYLLCSVYPWSGLDFPSVVILCFSFLI